jgi:hypothetical protein
MSDRWEAFSRRQFVGRVTKAVTASFLGVQAEQVDAADAGVSKQD